MRSRELGSDGRVLIDKINGNLVDCTIYYKDTMQSYENVNIYTFLNSEFTRSPFLTLDDLQVGYTGAETYRGVAVLSVYEDEKFGVCADIANSKNLKITRVPLSNINMQILRSLRSSDERVVDFKNADVEGLYIDLGGIDVDIVGSNNFRDMAKKRLDLSYENYCFSYNVKNFPDSVSESVLKSNKLCMRKLSDSLMLYAYLADYWHVFDTAGYVYKDMSIAEFEKVAYRQLLDRRCMSNAYRTVGSNLKVDISAKNILSFMTYVGGSWHISKKRISRETYDYLSKFIPKNMFTDEKGNCINDYLSLAI